MNAERFPWTRYWCPRGGQLRTDEDGFLTDPESAWGRITHPALWQLNEIENPGALLLLGEPGLGKSDAMAEARRVRAADATATVYAPPLQVVNSAQQLQAIFDDETVRAWAGGTGTLHLYLDALDECMFRVDVFGPLLVEELRSLPIERLRLYLACRTAEWPASFELELMTLLKAHGTQLAAYELAPLRRRDVESAAGIAGLDSAEFLKAIDRNGAAPLAIRPVTLNLLLRTFGSAKFPTSQLELYDMGMRALVTESAHRRETQLPGTLEPQERLVVAARIAALTIFTGRSVLERDGDQRLFPGVLPVWEIAQGYETASGRQLAVSEAAVNEVLNTGLFSLRGDRSFGWAHQTYAEYLAARYLRERNVTPTQVGSLLRAADGRVIPQLHGVAAWIAALSPDLFQVIAASDPEILIVTDIVLRTDEEREALIDHLLRRTRDGLRIDPLQARKLGRLAHARLHEQLAPYLSGRRGTEEQRDLALQIAIFSKNERLLSDVVMVALDTNAAPYLRQTAANGVITYGSTTLRARLKPLIVERLEDAEERLNWLGMQAAWPDSLSAAELFDALGKRKPISSLQAYSIFPVREIASGFTAETLPAGMRWAADREEHLRNRYQRDRADSLNDDFVDALLLRAWESLASNEVVLQCFTRVAWCRMRRWEPIVGSIYGRDFEEILRSDTTRRRCLAAALLATCGEVNVDVQRILSTSQGVLAQDDVSWLGQQLLMADDERVREAYAVAIVRLADPMQPTHAEVLFAAVATSPIVAETYGWICDVVELQSQRASEMRRGHAKAEAERRRAEEEKHRGPTAQQLREALASVTVEAPEQWWRFGRLLELSDEKSNHGDPFERDLTKLPGWSNLTAEDIQHAVVAAEMYVRCATPKPEDWLGKQVFHYGAAGGVRALALLAARAPDRLQALPRSVWETWAIAIAGVSNNAAELAVLQEGYENAPDAILNAIDEVIRVESQSESGDLRIARFLAPIWDSQIGDRLFALLTSAAVTSASARGALLETLLEHKHEAACRYAEGLLSALPMVGSEAWNTVVRAAVQLLSHVPDRSWAIVRAAMNDADFADAVIRVAAHEDQFRGAMLARFSEEQLGSFFELVASRFPSRTDPQHPKMKAISPSWRDDIARWRSMLLTSLMNLGTSAALEAIRHAIKALPNERYLPRALREAGAKWREHTWRPITTPQLLVLARDIESRFVDNAVQLAGVVEESLTRFQALLRGETPLVQFLWNEQRSGTTTRHRPKTENQMSDLIKVFLDLDLRRRGIIVNREVQIRPTITAGTGEVTDIHVDAAAIKNTRDRITTVVEAKGCWNDELFTAMKTQLRDRYLKENGDASGIYCVGWFQCAGWDGTDPRKRSTRSVTIEQIRRKLEKQAQRLSGLNRISSTVLDVRLPEPSTVAPSKRRSPAGRSVTRNEPRLAKKGRPRQGNRGR
jgi:hypothetical protein